MSEQAKVQLPSDVMSDPLDTSTADVKALVEDEEDADAFAAKASEMLLLLAAERDSLAQRVRELEQELSDSDGRADMLFKKAEECRTEWIRAENAEARAEAAESALSALQQDYARAAGERDALKEEAEKFRTAARVLCGAHIGVPQSQCPVCRCASLEAALIYWTK